jgi:CrcB protein
VLPVDSRELGAIFAGGAIGALSRAALVKAIPHGATSWPWGTFGVNVIGCFLLGYFATRLQERLPISAYRRPFAGTGLCGALTTFSTMQMEMLDRIRANRAGLAAAYAAASVSAGLFAVTAATAFVRRKRAW